MPRIAEDYAIAEAGGIQAYYGYEYNLPPNPWAEEDSEWGFQVKRGNEVLMRVPYSELRLQRLCFDQFDVTECLLAGLELWWEREVTP